MNQSTHTHAHAHKVPGSNIDEVLKSMRGQDTSATELLRCIHEAQSLYEPNEDNICTPVFIEHMINDCCDDVGIVFHRCIDLTGAMELRTWGAKAIAEKATQFLGVKENNRAEQVQAGILGVKCAMDLAYMKPRSYMNFCLFADQSAAMLLTLSVTDEDGTNAKMLANYGEISTFLQDVQRKDLSASIPDILIQFESMVEKALRDIAAGEDTKDAYPFVTKDETFQMLSSVAYPAAIFSAPLTKFCYNIQDWTFLSIIRYANSIVSQFRTASETQKSVHDALEESKDNIH